MATRLFRLALFSCAVLFACNAGSVVATSAEDDPALPDPSGDAEAGRNAGQSMDDGGPIADGQILPSTMDVEPGTPHVQLMGRFDLGDSSGPKCGWPGCRIVARFDGTGVSVRLKEILQPWMDGAPSEWDVAIDGVVRQKLVMSGAETTYVLASGLPSGAHMVELYKRSEGQNGTTQFMGFDFGGGTLLPPPARPDRRIEIIADSAAAGFGIEGIGKDDAGDCPGADHGALWQNFRLSLGARLADLVGAELHGTVYSGKGIAKNIWHPDPDTLPVVFRRAIPTDKASTWDFREWEPHVVVVMAGGNDFAIGKPYDEGPASLAQFTAKYDEFVGELRGHYPQAHLLLTVSPSVSDDEPAGRATRTNVMSGVQAVTADRNARGDAKVYWYAPRVSHPSEMTACNGHGNPQFHQRVAAELAAFIRPKVGW